MFTRFSDEAHTAIVRANQEAQCAGQNFVDTERLLVALITPGDSNARRILVRLGLEVRELSAEISKAAAANELPRCGTTAVIDAAIAEANLLRHAAVGSEHLLLGLLRESTGIAGRVLRSKGLVPDLVRQAVIDCQE